MPTMVALMIAVGILRSSGFLEMAAELIGKFTVHIGFPGELVPLTIVKNVFFLCGNRAFIGSL